MSDEMYRVGDCVQLTYRGSVAHNEIVFLAHVNEVHDDGAFTVEEFDSSDTALVDWTVYPSEIAEGIVRVEKIR